MAEPSLLIVGGETPRRKRGRPRANEARSWVSTWVPVSLHDRLIREASAREISVSALVRDALVIAVPPKKNGT